jgi:hypothetical protein
VLVHDADDNILRVAWVAVLTSVNRLRRVGAHAFIERVNL